MTRVVVLLLLAVPALPHEFWIEPDQFNTEPGQLVRLGLRVGDGYPGEAYARNPRHVRRFFVREAGQDIAVPGRPGANPAGAVRLTRPGLAVVGYRSHATRIELPAKKFNAYLAEEGLTQIIAVRKLRGELNKPGRELFSRCAKSLIACGHGKGLDQRLGLELELVADANPVRMLAGATLPVRLFLKGKPLPRALVLAFRHGESKPALRVRTDKAGRARLDLSGGRWLISAVHMRPAAKGSNADWESLWASLTFQRKAKRKKPAKRENPAKREKPRAKAN